MSGLDTMQNMFLECPVCGSREGYEPSVFYPCVACKSCKSEWVIYPYGMELKAIFKADEGDKFLNKKYSFDFWKDFQKFGKAKPPLAHRIFAPMDCIGGVPKTCVAERSSGYLIFKSEDTMTYVGEGDAHGRVEIQIPTKRLNGVFLKDNRWLQFAGWVLLGWAGINAMNKKSLVIEWMDSTDISQKLIFDYHDDEGSVKELMNLLSQFIKKQ